jgi:acetoin utilization deacetylase AcuC-like enzyme
MQVATDCKSCNGRLVSVLEGGYDLEPDTNGLAQAVQAHVQELMRVSDGSRREAASAGGSIATVVPGTGIAPGVGPTYRV